MLIEIDEAPIVNVQMTQHRLRTDQLGYELPPQLVATRPAEPRDSARLLVMSRSGTGIEHARVRDLPRFLRAGDAMVFNDSAVIPARLVGRRVDTSGRVEGLFLEEAETDGGWLVLLSSNGRLRPGVQVELLDTRSRPSGRRLHLGERRGDAWIVRLEPPGPTAAVLDAVGWTPIPPYILKARREGHVDDERDRVWYETVYADPHRRHSVAAPTAGLHFTPALLADLDDAGVRRLGVTLHVGAGTFRPIRVDLVEKHRMDAERFEVSASVLAAVRAARGGERGPAAGRVIAVGTTVVRVLESLPAAGEGPLAERTDLLITPPYRFKHTDGMLTNFHLPHSTLLALVAAMVGLERLKAVYREAIERRYRFYSYGDAMLVLP